MESFRASAIQFRAGSDKRTNLEQASALVEAAAVAGSRLVVLPELFTWRGPQHEESAMAEPVPGPSSELLAGLARRLGIHLVAGSMLERSPDPERCFNTSLLFGPDGELLASYRKIHLFRVELPGHKNIDEARTRCPGDEVVCVQTELGRIGLSICYDLRFPELFRRQAAEGVEIVTVVSAFTAPTGNAHWHTLVRARAIENQCYLIAADQWGETVYGFSDYGHSIIVDPWGETMAEAGPEGSVEISAKLDATRLERVRADLPALGHRTLDR